jgi:cytoskeletal protein RodZ
MEKISHLLRQERERRGLSLQDIERELRIPLHYLELLEGSSDRRFLADLMYLIPLLRTYAAFLQFDQGEVLSRFAIELHESQHVREKAIDSASLPRLLTSSLSHSRLWTRIAIVLLALGLLVAVGHYSEMDARWHWPPARETSPFPPVPTTSSDQEPHPLSSASSSSFSASFPEP